MQIYLDFFQTVFFRVAHNANFTGNILLKFEVYMGVVDDDDNDDDDDLVDVRHS